VVSAVFLEVESSVGSKLRDLHIFQDKDPKGSDIIRAIYQQDAPNGRYLVRTEVLYAKQNIRNRDRHCQLNWRTKLKAMCTHF